MSMQKYFTDKLDSIFIGFVMFIFLNYWSIICSDAMFVKNP